MSSILQRLRDNISGVFFGNPLAVDQVICCLVAKGHVLIEDVPGVGKTVLATALARSVDCRFSRIQLTPDMLPSDILGVSIYRPGTNGHANSVTGDTTSDGFEFKRGPIFANIVLTDEINRTPPRTQSALLEAMAEGAITIDGRTLALQQPFMIVATQNPFDFEGTYPLPENQLDRFFMRINLGYPTPEVERRVLSQRPADHALASVKPVMHADDVLNLQQRVDQVNMDASLIDYIVRFAAATRQRADLHLGLSPRGALALAQSARATAVLNERNYVIPEDITRNILPVCAHRVIGRSYSTSRSTTRPDGTYAPDSVPGILMSTMQSINSPV